MDMTDKEITTFEAECAACGEVFDHPLLGDMAYGEFVFCSTDGLSYAYCSAFKTSARLIGVLLPVDQSPEILQAALAALADPMFGHQLTNQIICPKCHSSSLKSWGGRETGSMWVKPVSYSRLLELDRTGLRERVADFVEKWNP